jgi:Arc/MetJ-type ribon-helix-helix transcriptional regulator
MEVKLDTETEKLVQKEIETGRFPNAAALVGVALQHYFIAREFGEEYTREEIDEKIGRGLAQLEAGEGVDGEEFFERLKKRGQEIRSRSK